MSAHMSTTHTHTHTHTHTPFKGHVPLKYIGKEKGSMRKLLLLFSASLKEA